MEPQNLEPDSGAKENPGGMSAGVSVVSDLKPGLRQAVGHLVEGAGQLVAHGAESGHQDHGDERGDQTILDGRGAGFVLQEACDEIGHIHLLLSEQSLAGFKLSACSPNCTLRITWNA